MSLSPRAAARAPVRRQLLAASFDKYHREHVVPHFVRYDRAILALGGVVLLLAAAVIWLVVDRVA